MTNIFCRYRMLTFTMAVIANVSYSCCEYDKMLFYLGVLIETPYNASCPHNTLYLGI